MQVRSGATELRRRPGPVPARVWPAAGPPVVEATGLRVVRGGRTVLRDLSFGIPRGGVTGLLGPGGCGKTTLLRCLVGVQRVARGEVRVLDRPAGSAAVRARVGYVPQAPALYPDLDVAENLRYFARLAGASRERVGQVVERLRLGEHARSAVGSLPGGERTRVSLAVALLGDPEVLVLDEPTVGLDPLLRHELWQLFHALAGDGTTLVVSSHVMDEAARCQRLLLMRDGELLADDTPAGLRAATCTEDLEEAFLRLVAGREQGRAR